MSIARRLLLVAFVSLGAAVSALPACGSSSPAAPSDLDGGAPPAEGGVIDGIASLAITPATSTLTLAPGGVATTKLTATGTFKDGTTRDVTASVSWSTDATFSSIDRGAFTTHAPGTITVNATSGSVGAKATIKVSVSGDVVVSGFDPSKKAVFDGTPSTGAAPTVAYPLAGALIPGNLAPVDVQLKKGNGAQSLVRLAFKVEGVLDVKVFAACTAIDGAADGCSVLLDDVMCALLAGASEAGPLVTTIRMADGSGGNLGEVALKDVAWTTSPLGGGLYYWTTINSSGGTKTAINRFDLDHPQTPPVTYFTEDDAPPLAGGGDHPCVGCHAVSHDGRKLALIFGGSDPSNFELVQVTGKSPIATRNTDPAGYATFTTFGPDGNRIVNAFRGALTLRAADATLADVGALFGDTTDELKSHPYWSPDGKSFTFVSWKPNENGAGDSKNGDLVRGGQIWIAPSDGAQMTGKGTALVPRAAGKTSYYPTISDDGAFVAFNQSSCDGPPRKDGYGLDPCDGYDDASARVKLVAATGGAPIDLANLNGAATWTNSWPRFSPGHGSFRGKTIYWVAFSSKRPYGLRLSGSESGDAKPQLWFAAVSIEPGKPASIDPSFAPVWLPLQNPDATHAAGNHVPQWAVAAVPVR